MKIVSAHEGVIPISSSMSNAFIDFSSMDCSILALVSDVVVDGKPLVGYGFNSNGRYSAGDILRRRILPRLMDAPADALLDESGELSPSAAWDVMMRNEKPGGHGERSVAVGVSSTWRCTTWPPRSPGFRCTAGSPTTTATASPTSRSSSTPRRLLRTGQDPPRPPGRDEGLPRRRLQRRQDEDRWRRPGRGPAPDRSRHRGPRRRRFPPCGRRQRQVRPRHRPGVRPRTRPVRPVLVRGGRRPSGLRPQRHLVASTTATPSRPGRTSSPSRTPATSSGTPACARTATTSRSIPP